MFCSRKDVRCKGKNNQVSVDSFVKVVETRQKIMVPVSSPAANTQWLHWEGCAWKQPRYGVSD